MQGLWSTHRKNVLNLNASIASTHPMPATGDLLNKENPAASTSEDAGATSSAKPNSAADGPSNGKRKLRTTKTVEGNSSKRSKLLTSSSSAISKEHSPPTARLSDLGGVEACVEKMLELVAMPLCHPEVYLHTGIKPPCGVLLHGPPGCGKTLLAHAIAGVRFTSLYFNLDV
jgi:ribosome biogenesis ATPase